MKNKDKNNNYNNRKNNSNNNGSNSAIHVTMKTQTMSNDETLVLKWR